MSDEYDESNFNAGKLGQYVTTGKTGKQLSEDILEASKKWSNIAGNEAALAETNRLVRGEAADYAQQARVFKHTYVTDGSDAKGNAGFTVSFQHVPSEETVYFKAFLMAFNENYRCDWASETVFGRPDPLMMFKSTTRTVSVGLSIPASTVGEGFENLHRLQKLIQFLYPTYEREDNALSIKQSPLIRLRVMNLLSQTPPPSFGDGNYWTRARNPDSVAGPDHPAGHGLLGQVSNLTIDHGIHDPQLGSFEINGGTIIPKAIEIQFDFQVLHEHQLGWNETTQADATANSATSAGELAFALPNFPYDLDYASLVTPATTPPANAATNAAAAAPDAIAEQDATPPAGSAVAGETTPPSTPAVVNQQARDQAAVTAAQAGARVCSRMRSPSPMGRGFDPSRGGYTYQINGRAVSEEEYRDWIEP